MLDIRVERARNGEHILIPTMTKTVTEQVKLERVETCIPFPFSCVMTLFLGTQPNTGKLLDRELQNT